MRYYGRSSYDHTSPALTGILLTNVGTPTAPTQQAVRPYLSQFLGDPRIIEYPRWLWWLLLNAIILNTRPRRSARLYQNVWTEAGSPLLVNLQRQSVALQKHLQERTGVAVPVAIGMRYGAPTIREAMRQLDQAGVRRLLVFPLYPQYSATTTATAMDGVYAELQRWRWQPELRTIMHYHDHPGYIAALVNSVQEYWQAHGKAERLLFSFHGIPKRYFRQGDPYFCECQKTARLLATGLGLAEGEYGVSFQSRFGPEEWLKPYTDKTLEEWGHHGVRSVQVLAPGFSGDCLETIDELGREGKETFLEAGGQSFAYIPALNDRPDHMTTLTDLALQHLQGWELTQALDAQPHYQAFQDRPHA